MTTSSPIGSSTKRISPQPGARQRTEVVDLEQRKLDLLWLADFRKRWWVEDRLSLARLTVWTALFTVYSTIYSHCISPILGPLADGTLAQGPARIYGGLGTVVALACLAMSVSSLSGVKAAGRAQSILEEEFQRVRTLHLTDSGHHLGVANETTLNGRLFAENVVATGVAVSLLAAAFAAYAFFSAGM